MATTISGVVTGALAGGVVGILVGIGIPEKEAKIYEQHIKEGGILVMVPTKLGEEDGIRKVFADHGAAQIRLLDQEDRDLVDRSEYKHGPYVDEGEPAYLHEIKK